ncbi:MAG: 16S rRNA (cytosine(1402)-N(4))-methyltransferase RsmH, partial [Phycisphaerales bacterium]|nr:16S rRNA (cytosine(1402)-N(4))-methyltransferase RsmH [Phycisphaerales bacterium]
MPSHPLHIPVLLDEVLTALNPQPGQIIVDCTLGLAGHAAEILKRLLPASGMQACRLNKVPRLIAIDFDPHNIAIAEQELLVIDPTHQHFAIFHNNFAALPTILATLGLEKVNGLLADLGFASTQIDDPARGFSYRHTGPLDMRMDPTRGQPASVLLNRLSEKQIADALLELGDETDAPAIARHIVQYRRQTPITTTQQLMALVCHARDFTL